MKLKIAYFSEKIFPISLKLNFTPNTLGCKGLGYGDFSVLRVKLVDNFNESSFNFFSSYRVFRLSENHPYKSSEVAMKYDNDPTKAKARCKPGYESFQTYYRAQKFGNTISNMGELAVQGYQ